MTRHRLIFLKESVGFALSVKLKMLDGEHLSDTVIHPVHAVDYHSSTLSTPFPLAAAGSDLSNVCRCCCPCNDTTALIDASVWCGDTDTV